MRTFFLLAVILVIIGCRNTAPTNEQVGLPSYVASKIATFSGKPIKVVEAQELGTVIWSKQEDSGGTKIIVQGDHFKPVDKFFQEMLGKPWQRELNDRGFEYVTYHVRQHGVAVTYEVRDDVPGYPKSLFILILKPMTFK